jgi:peptidoglycan hydrolase CwlO-like protein
MNTSIKNIILKLGMALLATIVAGNGYELIQEVRELKLQAERTERAFIKTTEALEIVATGLQKMRTASASVMSQCSEARNEGIRIRSSIEELRKQIEELRKKLRLQAKVLDAMADK